MYNIKMPTVQKHKRPSGQRRKRSYGRKKSYASRKQAQKTFRLPKPKRSVVNQLSNLLETKKFQGLDYDLANAKWIQNPIEVGTLPLTNAGVSFMPDSFYRMQFATDIQDQTTADNKELVDNCIEGTSLFSKYLQCKVQIDYPDGLKAPTQAPRPVEIIWGWVNPLNFTKFTNPHVEEVTPSQIREHTLDAIASEFNAVTDPMEFHDKHKRRYNIIGRRKIMPRLARQVPTKTDQQFGPHGNSSAKIHTNIYFPMKKKVNYTRSTAEADPSVPQFAYPNEAYLPFVYLYNPDYAMYDVSGVDPVAFKFNDCHWFNDA